MPAAAGIRVLVLWLALVMLNLAALLKTVAFSQFEELR